MFYSVQKEKTHCTRNSKQHCNKCMNFMCHMFLFQNLTKKDTSSILVQCFPRSSATIEKRNTWISISGCSFSKQKWSLLDFFLSSYLDNFSYWFYIYIHTHTFFKLEVLKFSRQVFHCLITFIRTSKTMINNCKSRYPFENS